MWESAESAFQAYGSPLSVFALFKYLGRFLKALYHDWPAVLGNLRKAQKS